MIDETQRYLFHEGNLAHAYRMLGAHPAREQGGQDGQGRNGYEFAVWAPNAQSVSVVGDFNLWNPLVSPMRWNEGGIWTCFCEVEQFASYKYAIQTHSGAWQLKADPYAFHAEVRPYTASKVFDLAHCYEWHDGEYLRRRAEGDPFRRPLSIYEMHLGSWRRGEGGRLLSYREIADALVPYVLEMGFTHVQFLPVLEHPLDMSWGYQVTGFFAATSRYGRPDELMALIDALHAAGIGVLLDWVPGHFTKDAHGLRRFDGTALYEHEDPRQGEHREWGTHIFNYGRSEVMSFLLSGAMFWLEMYHVDGLRVDAVSSMLYLNFCKEPGQWVPNRYGGTENLEAIELLRKLNTLVYREYPGALMIAEESTAFPMVTHPVHLGGLGFGYKWNMGWMNDILHYIETDSIFRKYDHSKITFSLMYAFSENFILPFSHDEVVHGKKSLLSRMPGDYWRKFAGLRGLFGYMYAHPGKKLMFMGCEFGQFIEWKYDDQLDWFLLDYESHASVRRYVRDLNAYYLRTPALWQVDDSWQGFEWLVANDIDNSAVAFLRRDASGADVLCMINFTPEYHPVYRVGLPGPGTLYEEFNSDLAMYGGSDQKNPLPIATEAIPWNAHPYSATVSLPPLGAIFLRYQRAAAAKEPGRRATAADAPASPAQTADARSSEHAAKRAARPRKDGKGAQKGGR